ncbi:unnamed protein product [Malus baccata var. baccata]
MSEGSRIQTLVFGHKQIEKRCSTSSWIKLTKDVVDVKRVKDRIIAIKIMLGQELLNVISLYTPQVGLDKSMKETFW